jgi:hypothetical protein
VRTKTTIDFLEVLRVLVAHEIKFIVVGGVSAVLQGAPIATFDLDLVHSRDSENIQRLLRAGAITRSEVSALSFQRSAFSIQPNRFR